MNRYQIKPQLRTICEIGIISILGRIPRRLRRSSARGFANASYRKLKGLPKLRPTSDAFTDWATSEYEKLHAIGDQNLGTNPPTNGPVA